MSLDESRRDSLGIAVLGAGPAGLAAARVLGARGEKAAVLEADDTVGGLARTVEHDGYRFDLGGHRFFTKLEPIQRLWEETLGSELLTRARLSRIYYDGKFFSYPLKAEDVVSRLGLREAIRCLLSYLRTAARRERPARTFQDWVTARFGPRLYETFFRDYTEKVWGIPGSQIDSQWAAQRIKDFSLPKAVLRILGVRGRYVTTTLIGEFRYPRLGPGQMWDAFAERIEEQGIAVQLNARCVAVRHEGGRVNRIAVRSGAGEVEYDVDAVLSSIPLPELIQSLVPAPPDEVIAAGRRLRYRDLCLVALMTSEESPFPDNWIYLHDPATRAGRVQNFGAWSEDMVKPGTTCLGVEYFCFEGDETWELSEEEAVELATRELAGIGLIDPARVVTGARVRVPKAYPMYDLGYGEAVDVLRAYLDGFENLQTFGRNGLHRYNNQDHSMWSAILATLNLLDRADHDVWAVNTEAEYHEEGRVVASLLETGSGAGRGEHRSAEVRAAPFGETPVPIDSAA